MKMLLASLRHIREIGPESNIYCLSAFELSFFPLPVSEVWDLS